MIVADEIDTPDDDDEADEWPSSDAVDFWRDKTAPILELLRQGPLTLGQLKEWARKARIRSGIGLVEHGIAWLEMRGEVGRVARSGGFAYALPEALAPTPEPVVIPTPPPSPPTPPAPSTTEDNMSSDNWVNSEEAARLLGVSRSALYNSGIVGQLERRPIEGARGFEYSRASIIKVAADRRAQAGAADAPQADPARKRTALAPRPKARPPAVVKPQPATGDAAELVRWVLTGRRLGQFTEAEALERIEAAIGA